MSCALEPAKTRMFRSRRPIDDLAELCPKPGIILDCGAGAGFFSGECDKVFPGATVYSFEPVSELFEKLRYATKRMLNPRGICQNALTNTDAPLVINLTEAPKSNSLLGFLPGGPLEDHLRVVGTETVKGIRLDSWLKLNKIDPAAVGILKLDLQGAELLALDGATELLKHRPVVLTEVSFQEQYQDHPLLEHVDEFLAQHGYRRLYLYSSARPEIWGDAIYVPADRHAPGHLPAATSTQISQSPIRLNIGAGPVVIPGFTPIDRKLGSEAYPLAYADNSVDEIRASHILEHFDYKQLPLVLEDWKRALKPGGLLRISVPDFRKVATIMPDDPSWRFFLMGGQMDADDYHRSAFDEPTLRQYLDNAGLVDVRPWSSSNTDCAANPISLNLEARKPSAGAPETLEIKIQAMMSIPRIGWNDASQAIECTLRPFGINCVRFNGVFWGQCMQRAFQEALDEGVDWLLTLDYDSMVTPWHLGILLQQFGQNAHIDALAALQMRRGQDFPLMTQAGKTEADVSADDPIKVHSAHFGLTLIRADALRDIKKPWFASKPDANGDWNDNRLDDDIWFWHQWRLAGKSIYVSPACRIGHLELMVSEFDADMRAQHVPIADWWSRNGGKAVGK